MRIRSSPIKWLILIVSMLSLVIVPLAPVAGATTSATITLDAQPTGMLDETVKAPWALKTKIKQITRILLRRRNPFAVTGIVRQWFTGKTERLQLISTLCRIRMVRQVRLKTPGYISRMICVLRCGKETQHQRLHLRLIVTAYAMLTITLRQIVTFTNWVITAAQKTLSWIAATLYLNRVANSIKISPMNVGIVRLTRIEGLQCMLWQAATFCICCIQSLGGVPERTRQLLREAREAATVNYVVLSIPLISWQRLLSLYVRVTEQSWFTRAKRVGVEGGSGTLFTDATEETSLADYSRHRVDTEQHLRQRLQSLWTSLTGYGWSPELTSQARC
jgi:hypothetical protein